MLLKLYERNAKGTVYDKYEKHSSKHYKILKYCPQCNSDLFGEWNYDCREIKLKIPRFNQEELYRNDTIDDFLYKWEILHPEKLYIETGSISSDFLVNVDAKDMQYIELMDITPLIKKYRQEIDAFSNISTCPVCGYELSKDENNTLIIKSGISDIKIVPKNANPSFSAEFLREFNDACIGSYINYNGKVYIKANNGTLAGYNSKDNDSILKHFRSFRESGFLSKSSNMLKSITDKYAINEEVSDFPVGAIKTDVTKLKDFISNIVQIETNIFSVSKRLRSLYYDSLKYKPDASASVKILKIKLQTKVAFLNEEYDDLVNKGAKNAIEINDVPMEYPAQPTKPKKDNYPIKPVAPELKKVNFLNKKYTIAENERAIQKYNEECINYTERCKAIDEEYEYSTKLYNEEYKIFEHDVSEFEVKRKEIYDAMLSDIRIKLDAAIKNANAFEELSASITTPEQIKSKLIDEEISQAEDLLKSLYEARNKFYGSGIIFKKYCNFVAVSSLYEYLCAGRCDKLEGMDGAYNIYENEIRLDTVISQLTQVIQSLEQIQKNQYVIYSAIKETNRQLDLLKTSMANVVCSLDEIKSNVSDITTLTKNIAENTEISLYYSQVNAFYSKKNAELTNALGFITALK